MPAVGPPPPPLFAVTRFAGGERILRALDVWGNQTRRSGPIVVLLRPSAPLSPSCLLGGPSGHALAQDGRRFPGEMGPCRCACLSRSPDTSGTWALRLRGSLVGPGHPKRWPSGPCVRSKGSDSPATWIMGSTGAHALGGRSSSVIGFVAG